MLINTSITIAFKCSSCGSFEFFSLSAFSLLNKKNKPLECGCRKSSLIIERRGRGGYTLTVPCIGCGDAHVFVSRVQDLIERHMQVFCCPVTGVQLCFIGNDEVVRKKVDSLESEFDELIDAFGYDSYFKNTRVMFDALNKLHDIAEQGNLLCECGGGDIELMLLPDRIQLSCKRCLGNRIIFAASNKDLVDIRTRQQIILMGGYPDSIFYNQKHRLF